MWTAKSFTKKISPILMSSRPVRKDLITSVDNSLFLNNSNGFTFLKNMDLYTFVHKSSKLNTLYPELLIGKTYTKIENTVTLDTMSIAEGTLLSLDLQLLSTLPNLAIYTENLEYIDIYVKYYISGVSSKYLPRTLLNSFLNVESVDYKTYSEDIYKSINLDSISDCVFDSNYEYVITYKSALNLVDVTSNVDLLDNKLFTQKLNCKVHQVPFNFETNVYRNVVHNGIKYIKINTISDLFSNLSVNKFIENNEHLILIKPQ